MLFLSCHFQLPVLKRIQFVFGPVEESADLDEELWEIKRYMKQTGLAVKSDKVMFSHIVWFMMNYHVLIIVW
jgi:hypothetical protein